MWKFAERIIPDPNIIRLKREEETLDNIRQFYIVCKNKEEKFSALCNLYGCLTIAQTIVFCQVGQQSCPWVTVRITAKRVLNFTLKQRLSVEADFWFLKNEETFSQRCREK